METTTTTAYIALGSNLGDRSANIRAAIESLRATSGIHVVRESTLLENASVGGPPDAPEFLNGALEVQTTLSAHELLNQLLEIERTLGRERTEKWGPRTIDLDLLLFGDRVIDSAQLTVPHPQMHVRKFVLSPLAQIAPDVFHPVLKQSIIDLLYRL